MEGCVLRGPRVTSLVWLDNALLDPLAKPFDDEFLRVEVYWIAGFASPAVDTIQERQSALIED